MERLRDPDSAIFCGPVQLIARDGSLVCSRPIALAGFPGYFEYELVSINLPVLDIHWLSGGIGRLRRPQPPANGSGTPSGGAP